MALVMTQWSFVTSSGVYLQWINQSRDSAVYGANIL